jgi:hypothetical protein
MTDNRTTNRALLRHLLLPTVFLTVALLGGVRVRAEGGALLFIPPPLVTLVLAVMLMALFVRGRLIDVGQWLSPYNAALANVSHALTLAVLFFASAQAFNSVLPEAGLLRWILSFFFLWTLWQNQFSMFDARRLLRSLAALFGTAFVIKHMLLASLYASDGGWLKRLAGVALEGFTLGTLAGPAYAPATGYVSFFALALYVCGLALVPPSPGDEKTETLRAVELVRSFRLLPADERVRVLDAIGDERVALLGRSPETLEASSEMVEPSSEIFEGAPEEMHRASAEIEEEGGG